MVQITTLQFEVNGYLSIISEFSSFQLWWVPADCEWRAIYDVQYKYLTIFEIHVFPGEESFDNMETFIDIVDNYIFQFKYYFNELWC